MRVLALTLAVAVTGCITTAGVVRRDRVTLPILLGAVAADLVISPLVLGQSDSLSTSGAIASGIAVTAADFGIGCIIGACQTLRP